jgi:transposase InsO family protein
MKGKRMDKDRIAMSQAERDRLKVMAPVLEGKRLQREAARLLGRSVRQVRRIQRRLEAEGDGGIIHKLRGRPSNNRQDPELRQAILGAYRRDYQDFGPTLAAEKLAQRGLRVCRETVRQWLLAEGLWQRKRKRDKHRRRRQRRECFGELVQADGSHHDWLEGRGERMVLVAMIDDATSKAVGRFYPAETTEAYMDLLGRYLRKRGRMIAMYVDRDSIFRAEDHDPRDPQPVLTQFARALEELAIELSLAHSPQAKGRIERFFQTAQDRLVKELRLAGATTIQQANELLDKTFLPLFNRRFTVKAASGNNAHRPLHPSMNLQAILSIQQPRTVSNDYTIRLHNVLYQLLPPAWPGLRGGKVIVEHRLDGSLHIRFGKRYLKYQTLGPATPGRSLGALPPDPRSLSPWQMTAPATQSEGRTDKAAQPCAVHPTAGRSGRTPAEPYPPDGEQDPSIKQPSRPGPEHPWRKPWKNPPNAKQDILTLAK